MKVAVFGLGYVGTVSAACLAKQGHSVVGVDINATKVDLINSGKSPIVERDLDNLLQRGKQENLLSATLDAAHALQNAEVSLICVGTPSQENGALDLTYVKAVVRQIGEFLRDGTERHLIAIRSTMLPGSLINEIQPVLEEASGRTLGNSLELCVNPEFLREGTAVSDYFSPPFTLIGTSAEWAAQTLSILYEHLDAPVIQTDIRVAEMVKYCCNAFHALKVVFANEIGQLCKKWEIDSHRVMDVFVQDTHLNISAKYLRPGFAFGGSCLPKDLRALLQRARNSDLEPPLLAALLPSNDQHLEHAFRLIQRTGNRKIGILGLAFKAGTDDLRESPMVRLIERLVGKGYDVRVYDKDVALSRVIGTNRRYIEEVLPHISDLLVQELQVILDHSESIVVGDNAPELHGFFDRISPNQQIIDLVRDERLMSQANGQYQGICW